MPAKTHRLENLQKRISAADFWSNAESAQQTIFELKKLKSVVEPYQQLKAKSEDLYALIELLEEDNDPAGREELQRGLKQLAEGVSRLELLTLLNGPDDEKNCFFSIHAGAGGTESCDWAAMLLRMYCRYFEQKGYSYEQLDLLPGEEAGIRSCTLRVIGPYAYGYLSCEAGVHRLVRISPFDAQNRRHTSFASVDVMPEYDEQIEINIDWDKDVREDTYRASGKGGQHVNKTSSAVRLTHLPTGIVVQCQNERSQHQNRRTARRMLVSRLMRLERQKRDARLAKLYSEKGEIAWANQIRSYFLHPTQRVKDARSGYEVSNAQAVLDGELQGFIEAELRRRAAEANRAS